MDDNLLRIQDLVSNPMARVPVCLVLDFSDSMNAVVSGTTHATGEQVFRDGKLWNLVEGGVTAKEQMLEGVRDFYRELKEDEIAMYSAEVSVVTFSGSGAQIIEDFANLERQEEIPDLAAEGGTPMGEAVNLALDCLERRKQEYKDKGVDYFQPWLVLMTDGQPNGDSAELSRAIGRTKQMVNERKLSVFPVGIGNGEEMEYLQCFCKEGEKPFKLKEAKFKEFFQWLSQSVSNTSQLMPGEIADIDMSGIKSWSEL